MTLAGGTVELDAKVDLKDCYIEDPSLAVDVPYDEIADRVHFICCSPGCHTGPMAGTSTLSKCSSHLYNTI